MIRREFLLTGAAGLVGCATATWESDPRLMGRPIPSADRGLVESSLLTLMLVGTFRDLSPEQRSHPEVQARMHAGLSDMDRAVLGWSQRMESTSAAERLALQRRLRARPELVSDFAGALERKAEELGISDRTREHLRSMTSDIGWRIQHQPISMLFDECTTAVQKVARRDGLASQRLRRSLAEERDDSAGRAPESSAFGGAEVVGLVLMGLGLTAAGVGAGIAIGGDSGTAGLITVTVGAVLLLVGLITLLGGLLSD